MLAVGVLPDMDDHLEKRTGQTEADDERLDEVRTRLERLLGEDAGNAEMAEELIAVCNRMGDLEGALAWAREHAQLHFDAPDSSYPLGLVQLRGGEPVAAFETFRSMLHRGVEHEGLLYHAAQALRLAGMPNQALPLVESLVARAPTDARALNEHGMCLHLAGDIDAARDAYARATVVDPGFAKAHFHLGTACGDLGQLDEAVDAFEKALRLQPDSPDATAGLASVLERRGRAREALERLEQADARTGANANLALVFASVGLALGREQDAIEVVRRALEIEGLAKSSEEALRFALGRLLDAVGDSDGAMACMVTANALHPRRFDTERHARAVDELIEIYDADRLSMLPRSRLVDSPVFIVSMPRSGTTLLQAILAAHPDVEGGGELTAIDRLLNSLPEVLEAPEPHYAACLRALTSEHLDVLGQRYLDHLGERGGGARWTIDKMPQNFMHLGFISLLFPNARVLHCVRDPVDTCLSCYFQRFSSGHDYAYDLTALGRYHRDYGRLMAHWRRVLDIAILDVSYEALVRDTEGVSRRAAAFCGMPWSSESLRFHQQRQGAQTASYAQVRQPIYQSSVGRAKNYHAHLGALIDALGGQPQWT